MTSKINIKALAIFLLFCAIAIYSCNPRKNDKGKPPELTSQDNLPFLIEKSDLIALVTLSGGLKAGENLSWFRSPPETVKAEINTILSGKENRKIIEILSEPKHLEADVVMSIILLRNGYHLAFLSTNGKQYQPTTRSSLLNVFFNKLYPTWRTDQYNETGSDGQKISSGVTVEEVLKEIENEIKKANQTLNMDFANSRETS